jgi:hypothetical protein
MHNIFNMAYAAKAWVAGVVVAVGNVVTLVQVAAADEAISLTEAEGIWLAVTEAVTALVAIGAVYRARNSQ